MNMRVRSFLIIAIPLLPLLAIFAVNERSFVAMMTDAMLTSACVLLLVFHKDKQ